MGHDSNYIKQCKDLFSKIQAIKNQFGFTKQQDRLDVLIIGPYENRDLYLNCYTYLFGVNVYYTSSID